MKLGIKNDSVVYTALRMGLSIKVAGQVHTLESVGPMTLHNFIKLCDQATEEELNQICDQIIIKRGEK